VTLSLRNKVLLGGLLGAMALFHFLTISPGHGWGDDFAMYISHAKNLVEGRDYSDTGYIYNPEEPIAPPRAPPGLPLLLAPIYAVRGVDLVAMKMLMVAAFIAALAFLALLVQRWEGFGSALAVTALVGLHPFFWDFKNNVLSDLPFLCFFLGGLWLGERTLESSTLPSWRFREGLALGITWWLAYATRSIGLVLPVAFVATELSIRRRLHRSTLLALTVFASLAALQAAFLQGPSDYFGLFSFRPAQIAPRAVAYIRNFRGLFDSGFSHNGARAVFAITAILATVGMIRSWMTGKRTPAIISVVYLGVMLLWPWDAGVRYLIPVIPLYFYFVIAGLSLVEQRLARWRLLISICAASVILMIYGAGYYRGMTVPRPPGIDSPNAQSLFAFVRKSTPSTAVVVFKKPRALALYTGRKAAIYTTSGNGNPWDFIEKIGATHVALIRRSRQDSSYLALLERARPHSLTQVFANDEFAVYQRLH
jgi:hypothetical protein